ncbi:MAG: Hydrolase [Thermoleophilia bacterium]|nr:Hydrolase [Thermoleophilia bacterium]
MTVELGGAARAIASMARRDATALASDGRSIGYRVTQAVGQEKSVLVYMNGTAGKAALFDGMADQLAQRGITSYSITSRTHLDAAGRILPDAGYGIHADDLDRVVTLALREHPDTPAAVAGTSLGAVIAMHYNATRNVHGLPVVALAPVALDRFLPFADKAKLVASLGSERAGNALVATPMSVGRTMTTNPASEYVTHAGEMANTKVPARIFRDVLRMNVDTLRHAKDATGELHVVLGGSDQVSVNAVSRLVAKHAAPAGLRTPVTTLSGAPHELSQEWNDPRVVDALASVALGASRPR